MQCLPSLCSGRLRANLFWLQYMQVPIWHCQCLAMADPWSGQHVLKAASALRCRLFRMTRCLVAGPGPSSWLMLLTEPVASGVVWDSRGCNGVIPLLFGQNCRYSTAIWRHLPLYHCFLQYFSYPTASSGMPSFSCLTMCIMAVLVDESEKNNKPPWKYVIV